MLVLGVVDAGAAENLKTVKQIYADFQQGHLDKVLSKFAAEYTAQVESAAQVYPVFKAYNNNFAAFFAEISARFEFIKYEPTHFASNANQVMVIIVYSHKERMTGKVLEDSKSSQTWTFNKAGKIIAFSEILDTAANIDEMTMGQTPYSLMETVTKDIQSFNTRNPDIAYSNYAPDCVITTNSDPPATVEEAKAQYKLAVESIPDIRYEILKVVATGNYASAMYRAWGTFSGKPFMGVEPNNKMIEIRESCTSTIMNGWITEEHCDIDMLSVLIQLGVISM
jgi:predicted ester cyclase/ketosteroid isomerase-like protein